MEFNLTNAKVIFAMHRDIDPVIIDMMPENSQRVAQDGHRWMAWLVQQVEQRDAELLAARQELHEYKLAIAEYASQMGISDYLMNQNLGLCLDMVRQREKT